MNRFLRWLSKHTGGVSKDTLIEPDIGKSEDVQVVPFTPEQLTEIVQAQSNRLDVLDTSVNRIERKLNRWVELLGMKDIVKAAETASAEPGEEVAAPDPGVSPQPELELAGYPGQETE